MRKVIITFALAFIAVSIFAQNKEVPAGLRMEVAEAEINDEYKSSIFTYKDEDGTCWEWDQTGFADSTSHLYKTLYVQGPPVVLGKVHYPSPPLASGSALPGPCTLWVVRGSYSKEDQHIFLEEA